MSKLTCFIKLNLILTVLLLLQACGSGDSGAKTVLNPEAIDNGEIITASNYSGPDPITDDVQQFRLHLWDKIMPNNRCGKCHGEGGQSPMFVRRDDINLAYAEANSVVNLDSPAESLMAQKVAGGHNCWKESDSVCADLLTTYITAWAGGAAGTAKTIVLTAPEIKDAGASKNFPEDSGGFSANLHDLLTQHCSNCHSDTSAIAQSPYFASADVDVAYEAVKSKIDLETPANSRVVLRLGNEFHNCWSDCTANAAEMLAAVSAFASGIATTSVDADLVLSKALRLTDGILANSGGRVETNVIALYEFKTGSGSIAYDPSGIEPALDLDLSGDYTWIGGWGVQFTNGKAQGSTSNSEKLHDLISATGEYSLEAWVAPANVTQEGPAVIIGYSGGTNARNFVLGQTLYNYDALNRSTTTSVDGSPALSTPDAAEVLQATLQHVVLTYDPINGRQIYVNGELATETDAVAGGNLSDWDDSYALVLGNDVSNNRSWAGSVRMLAIHNRALTLSQITQNFAVGVGQKFYLLFSVAHLIDMPQSYFVLEVSQYDSYSYLFNQPFFISLDKAAKPESIRVKGMRIGINGREARVGQAYRNLDTEINSSNYTADTGQALSPIGTIIALEKGMDDDEFFLTFEQLGSHNHVVVEAVSATPAAPSSLEEQPDIGIRTFDEINATMSAVTGIATTQANVKSTYDTIKQQLPTVEDIQGFLAAHQMAVTQLSIEYCNALVENSSQRSVIFPDFNFSADVATAFNTAGRNKLIDPLLTRVMGDNLLSQPDSTDIKTELNALIDTLTSCGSGCAADRTETVVKAVCAAALGSAGMLLQ